MDGRLDPSPRDPPPASGRWWLAVVLLALPLISDWKLRFRAIDASIGGTPDPFVVLEVLVYAAVASWLLLRLRPGHRQRVGRVLLLWWAFVAVAATSALWSPFPLLAVVRAAQLVVLGGVVHVAARRTTRDQLHAVAHGFLVLCVVGCAIGPVYAPEDAFREAARFHWLFVHPVMAATWLGLGALVGLGYLLGARAARPGPRWRVRTYAVLTTVVVVGLVATETRTAAAAFLPAALVVAWLSAPRRQRFDVALVTGALTGVAALLLGPAAQSFLTRGQSAEDLSTLNNRTVLWADYLALWRQEPLFGYGLGATRGLLLEQTGLGGGHNAYIEALVDLGAVGLALWLTLLAAVTMAAVRLRGPAGRVDRPMMVGAMTFLLIMALTTEFLATPANVAMTFLGLLVAWTQVAARADRLAGRVPATPPGRALPAPPRHDAGAGEAR